MRRPTTFDMLGAVALCAATVIGVQAQQPAGTGQAAAAGGGRGGGPDPGALSVLQQLALNREMTIPSAITAAQTAAAAALVQASLTLPVNTAEIAAKAQALADAELALANARATGFERVQKALQPLNAAQIATYARSSIAGGAGRGGRGGPAASWETAYYDRTGFIQLFDGKTLNGWDGEAGKWDVQDGAIHRHQTLEPKNFVDFGQYHLHYKEVFTDFDLKVEFKIKSGNAGIQYRGRLESGIHAQPGEPVREGGAGGGGGGVGIPLRNVAAAIADPLGKPLPANIKTLDDALAAGLLPKGPPYGNGTGHPWQVSGYQFDIYDSPTGNIGALYEGQGRGFSANTGEVRLPYRRRQQQRCENDSRQNLGSHRPPVLQTRGLEPDRDHRSRQHARAHAERQGVLCGDRRRRRPSRAEGHHFAPARRTGGQRGVVPEYLVEEALKVTARGSLQQGSA